jgi:hypothetical protein
LEDHTAGLRDLLRPTHNEARKHEEIHRLSGSWLKFVTMWLTFMPKFGDAGIAEEEWRPLAEEVALLDDQIQRLVGGAAASPDRFSTLMANPQTGRRKRVRLND